MLRTPLAPASAVLGALVLSSVAAAQRGAPPARRALGLTAAEAATLTRPAPVDPATTPRARQRAGGARPAVLLTGYWPPTNEMIRGFSNEPAHNPNIWIGEDWRGLGYDVYAYFPEFNPPNCGNCGQGTGWLEVDYQDTSADFWFIADRLRPIAILTFSRGFGDTSWEVEMNQFNRTVWFPDYSPPTQPTPTPPDASLPAGERRGSSLPVEAIVDAVNAAGVGVNAFVCWSQDGGGFLSEFIAYHGVWYQALHRDPLSPDWCMAAGHVHVGGANGTLVAKRAAKVTLETVLRHLNDVLACGAGPEPYCVGAPNSVGPGATLHARGIPSIGTNELALEVQGLPAGAPTTIFYGTGRTQVALGDGWLCVASGPVRLPGPNLADANGSLREPLDLAAAPLGAGPDAVSAGGTWNFQAWYRDTTAAGFNASEGLAITFCP